MAVESIKSNLFQSPSMMGLGGVSPSKQPIESIGAIVSGSNPFAGTNKKEQYGVGLVNSDLKDMSYTLPNGQKSKCNTIGIG